MRNIFRRELRTQIVIGAAAADVWDVLTDFESYGQWTGIFRFLSGHLETGKKLAVVITPTESRSVTFRPLLIRADRQRELRWRGHLILPGLFDGEHYFSVEEAVSDGVRFVHGEIFSGFLVPWLWRDLDTETRKGFERFNLDLKRRVEERS